MNSPSLFDPRYNPVPLIESIILRVLVSNEIVCVAAWISTVPALCSQSAAVDISVV